MNREIPSSTLATLRGILVSSLSRENLGPHDLPVHEHTRHRPPRKVHFREGKETNSGGDAAGGKRPSRAFRESVRRRCLFLHEVSRDLARHLSPTDPSRRTRARIEYRRRDVERFVFSRCRRLICHRVTNYVAAEEKRFAQYTTLMRATNCRV